MPGALCILKITNGSKFPFLARIYISTPKFLFEFPGLNHINQLLKNGVFYYPLLNSYTCPKTINAKGNQCQQKDLNPSAK